MLYINRVSPEQVHVAEIMNTLCRTNPKVSNI